MDLLLKHLGKHEIDEYVDKTVRKHVGSTHAGGSSPYGGSHQYNEFTNGLHDNLGKMNLCSNSIAQSHTWLPATGDLQFNLGDRFQPFWMYGPMWPFLFTYGSHDMRHTGFRKLTVVNGTPREMGRHKLFF